MTVPSDSLKREYDTNGVSIGFNGPMSYVASYVKAYLRAPDGVITPISSSAYRVDRLGISSGTRVIFDVPPVSGFTLVLIREMPYEQGVDITNQGAFLPEVIEKGYDSLAMQIQQIADAVFKSGINGGFLTWNALGLRIINVGSPLNAGDAVNKAYVDAETAARISGDMESKTYAEALLAGLPSGLGTFIQFGAGATARTFQDKLRDTINPRDYGADPTGVTDSRSALIAADNAAFAQGKAVYFSHGTFLVSAAITGLKASWIGEASSLIKASNTLVLNGPSMLEWQAGSNQVIRGINVDFQSRVCTVGSEAVIGVAASDGFTIENCKVFNMTGSGIAVNGARDFKIINNYVARATASNSFNQAILVSSSARQSKNGLITGNTCLRSAININVTNCTVDNNDISDWGFGGGITMEQDVANSQKVVIRGNRISGGVGIDTNATRPMGIENWAPNSIIDGNICHSNSGSGIDQGGQNTRCSNNICYNNGQSSATGGIIARYGDATFNATGSSFTGNKCFDTQGTKTQTTGYLEQSASLANISVRANQFNSGAGVTPENIVSILSDYEGPSFSFQLSWDSGNIGAGASGTNSFSCPGASLGDLVTASFSGNLLGLQLTAYVNATNTVTLLLTNNTGAGVDLPAGIYRVKVEKYKNYPAY